MSRQDQLDSVVELDRVLWKEEMQRRGRHLAALRNGPKEALIAERQRGEDDFLYWLRNYGWLQNPKARGENKHLRIFPFVPWPRQEELYHWARERIERQEWGIVPKSREIGVTWLFLHMAYHEWLFGTHFMCILGSRKEELVDKKDKPGCLFERLRFIHSKQPDFLLLDRDLKPRRIRRRGQVVDAPNGEWCVDKHMILRNKAVGYGNVISGESTNADFSRGDRQSWVLLDEFAAVDAPVANQVWTSLESVANSVFAVYNVGSKGHITYELHHGRTRLSKEQVFEMDWTADPRRGDWFKRSRVRPVGPLSEEQFEKEYGLRYGAVSRAGRIYDANRYAHAYDEGLDGIEELRADAPLYGSWDFGSGASLLVYLGGIHDIANDRVLIDHEKTWQQTDYAQAGPDSLAMRADYGNRQYDFGDPAGVQRDSGQQSWEANLRKVGVPLYCLPGSYNSAESIEWGFKLVNRRLTDGRLMIHQRCTYLWKCLEEWARNLPAGVTLDYANQSYVGPKKDWFSHGGMALCYLALGLSWISGEMVGAPIAEAVAKAARMVDGKQRESSGTGLRPSVLLAKIAASRTGGRGLVPSGMPGSTERRSIGGMLRRTAAMRRMH